MAQWAKLDESLPCQSDVETQKSDEIFNEFWSSGFTKICEQNDIPRIEEFFGDDAGGFGSVASRISRLNLSDYRPWIKAMAYGRLTEHQFDYLVGSSEEFDYVDPVWLMIGEAYWWTENQPHDETDLMEALRVLATRNAKNAKFMEHIGYSFWGEPYVINPSFFKYEQDIYNNRLQSVKEGLEAAWACPEVVILECCFKYLSKSEIKEAIKLNKQAKILHDQLNPTKEEHP